MKKAIPKVPASTPDRERFDAAIKENLEIIMGYRSTPIKPLKSSATVSDIVAKINEIIERLQ